MKHRVKRDTPNLGLEPIIFFREEENDMKKFWDLVKDSIIVQGVVTLALVGVCCYLWGTQQVVPDRLWTALTFVLGFFFGAKARQITGRSK